MTLKKHHLSYPNWFWIQHPRQFSISQSTGVSVNLILRRNKSFFEENLLTSCSLLFFLRSIMFQQYVVGVRNICPIFYFLPSIFLVVDIFVDFIPATHPRFFVCDRSKSISRRIRGADVHVIDLRQVLTARLLCVRNYRTLDTELERRPIQCSEVLSKSRLLIL